MSIEARVEQLERMARAVDSILDDLVVNGDWKTTKRRHGVAPFAETPPAPQPASEGVRWFIGPDVIYRCVGNDVAQYKRDGRWYSVGDKSNAESLARAGWTECDSTGQPLAKPATEDAMENRAMAFVAANMNMCASGMLTNFARAEIARATASLRAEVGKQTQRASEYVKRCDEWIGRCSKVEQERDELRTRLAACEERENKLREILRSLEWDKDPEEEEACCPYCMTLDGELHNAGCKMAEAMAHAAALKEPSRGN